MKRPLLIILALLTIFIFASCGNNPFNGNGNGEGKSLIIFHLNGGIGTLAPVPFDEEDLSSGNGVYIETYNDISKEDYIFGGWNNKSDGTGEIWAPGSGQVYPQTNEDLNLYAQWYEVYNYGDIGPAGGVIFYSRLQEAPLDGYRFCEWMYLEIAPTEGKFWWGPMEATQFVGGTKIDVGSGKNNTDLIVEKLGAGTAAYFCKNYSYNGYADWFLPSQHEFLYVFKNIYKARSNVDVNNNLVMKTGENDSYWNLNDVTYVEKCSS